ncbi:LPS O-antigen chain length determinant protein WzzB [Siccibacter colletis]|uniref:LPS O-antigen chain length determinant protein WzzB n=1 Tax=Siccibacter colletis TaxID=1505757 RepID=UPI0028BEA333|nr:LPS O-antigen chain length determinant protein WzzB [Siccibacter colletis]WNN47294.1 LPS O-antigen chain length determinant protein WzzB [Siccibacter colletis]
MTTHTYKTVERNHDNSETIDLIDIFFQLWRGKVIIIAFTIFAIILAGLYLAFAKEKWTSSAIITTPDSGQVSSYTNAMNTLYPGNAPLVSDIQQQFFSRLNAALSARSLQLNNQEAPEKLSIEPTVKGQAAPLAISYVSDTPEKATKTLEKYITELNRAIAGEMEKDLTKNIDSRAKELTSSLQAMEHVAKEKQEERAKVLNQALLIAEQSGITKPQVQQSEGISDDTLFVLGSDALKAMIQNHATSPLPLTVDYYELRQNLLAVTALKAQPDTLYAFRYVMQPDKPIRRDSPKRALTLVLAVLLGGMIGAAAVLGRNAIREYNMRKQ